MTGEMNTLRNKRIGLLKGMQGDKANMSKYITATHRLYCNAAVLSVKSASVLPSSLIIGEFEMCLFRSGLSKIMRKLPQPN